MFLNKNNNYEGSSAQPLSCLFIENFYSNLHYIYVYTRIPLFFIFTFINI